MIYSAIGDTKSGTDDTNNVKESTDDIRLPPWHKNYDGCAGWRKSERNLNFD